MQKRIIWTFTIGLLLIIGITVFADKINIIKKNEQETIVEENKEDIVFDDEIKLNNPRGMYSNDFYIICELEKEGIIYYTFNCETPDPKSDNAYTYTDSIEIEVGEENKTIVLKLKEVYADQTESEVYTHTYLVGNYIEYRYDCLVLSIVGEPEDLYGYENGVFVKGKVWDDYCKENPEVQDYYVGAPANYEIRGDESERPVSIECFSSQGNNLIEQNAGLRISGGYSQSYDQKSFRLYARKEYDTQNYFEYPFFDTEVYNESDSILSSYKRLQLRTIGRSRTSGLFIRDALGSRLAKDEGWQEAMALRPISVYINGEYQGLYWLKPYLNNNYFEEKYGEFEGEFIVLDGGDANKKIDEADDEKTKKCNRI